MVVQVWGRDQLSRESPTDRPISPDPKKEIQGPEIRKAYDPRELVELAQRQVAQPSALEREDSHDNSTSSSSACGR
jgi:hypothetical protein